MTSNNEGRLADNILLFCRTLRHAGLGIGSGQVIEAGSAVLRTGIERRDDFYYALRAVLVNDPAQFRLFDQAFHIYFRNPRLLERMLGILLPTIEAAIRRLMEALTENETFDDSDTVIEIDQSASYSRREVLRHKDFEQMSLQEQGEVKQLLREEIAVIKDVPTRRFRPHPFGHRYDLRRSMQCEKETTAAPPDTGPDLRHFRFNEQLLANIPAFCTCAELAAAIRAQLCFRHAADKHQSPADRQGCRSRAGAGYG
jgi:uncharacterized protein with von Willebrand factor type A (vWA) domain